MSSGVPGFAGRGIPGSGWRFRVSLDWIRGSASLGIPGFARKSPRVRLTTVVDNVVVDDVDDVDGDVANVDDGDDGERRRGRRGNGGGSSSGSGDWARCRAIGKGDESTGREVRCTSGALQAPLGALDGPLSGAPLTAFRAPFLQSSIPLRLLIPHSRSPERGGSSLFPAPGTAAAAGL